MPASLKKYYKQTQKLILIRYKKQKKLELQNQSDIIAGYYRLLDNRNIIANKSWPYLATFT